MSAHVEVLSTDLRRAKVKVTPGTYIIDVLQRKHAGEAQTFK